jgi:hypothetical protein
MSGAALRIPQDSHNSPARAVAMAG